MCRPLPADASTTSHPDGDRHGGRDPVHLGVRYRRGGARADRTPPTAPYITYASGLRWTGECLTPTLGLQRSTDNATPQSALTYEVFADGTLLGTLSDNGSYSAVWGVLHLRKAGPNTITAKAVDAAGNRSAASNAQAVTGYAC